MRKATVASTIFIRIPARNSIPMSPAAGLTSFRGIVARLVAELTRLMAGLRRLVGHDREAP